MLFIICLLLSFATTNIGAEASLTKKPVSKPLQKPTTKPTNKPSNKYVIGNHSEAGMFSIVFGVLNHIRWCDANHKIPVVYWGKTCSFYEANGYNGLKNAWEYYFEPVSKLQVSSNDEIHSTYFAPDGTGIDPRPNPPYTCMGMYKFKKWVNALIKKHIKIKPHIMNQANEFYKKHMEGKKTIGIHLRGTDKNREVPMTPTDLIINEANKYEGYQYFIATDDNKLLEEAKKKLKGDIIYFDSIRSDNNKPIHLSRTSSKAIVGEQVIIEMLLLTSCQKFIHTCSNVSMAVHYFNPDIDAIFFHPNNDKYIISGEEYKKVTD